MDISDPYEPVPFDTIPYIILNIQVDRIGTHLPDLIQQRIIAAKAPPVFQIFIQKDALDALYMDRHILFKGINSNEAKSR